MPLYRYQIVGEKHVAEVELADDAAAWSQVVTYCSELLRDADGHLPSPTEMELRVSEGQRRVATVRISAVRGDLDEKRPTTNVS